MQMLWLKLLLTPAFIGGASLAGRRWGAVVSGLLVGLPLTSGPIALFLALDHGATFAAAAAVGILAGGISVAIFCLAYTWLVFWLAWPLAILAGWAVFFASTALLQLLTFSPLPLFLGIVALLAVVARLLPPVGSPHPPKALPWWDIPGRMLVATAFVVGLTGLAPRLGSHLSGLLAPFPIYISILGIFTHRLEGPQAVAGLMRGVVAGLYSFVAFFLVVALLLTHAGVAVTFLLASMVTLAIQGAALWLVARRKAPEGRHA